MRWLIMNIKPQISYLMKMQLTLRICSISVCLEYWPCVYGLTCWPSVSLSEIGLMSQTPVLYRPYIMLPSLYGTDILWLRPWDRPYVSVFVWYSPIVNTSVWYTPLNITYVAVSVLWLRLWDRTLYQHLCLVQFLCYHDLHYQYVNMIICTYHLHLLRVGE